MEKRYSIITAAIVFNAVILLFILSLVFGNLGITGFAVSDFGDYRVYIVNAYTGKDVSFVIPIDNGEDRIIDAHAEITILNREGEEVAFLETGSKGVESNEKSELRATWFGSGAEGTYQARILIFNDGESYSFSKNFELEKETLVFESVIVHDFKLGGVINMSALIQNHLDERIDNVSISILILDNGGNTLSEILSEKKGIEADSISEFEILWDTKGINPDRYNAKMIINYGDEFIDRDLIVNIQEGSFDIVGVGYSIAGSPAEPRNNSLMFMLIVILVIGNLIWIVYYLRTKSGERNSVKKI